MSGYNLVRKIKYHANIRTDVELSEMCGVERSTFVRLRKGLDIGIKMLSRIAKGTGIPIGTLADWWEEPDPSPGQVTLPPESILFYEPKEASCSRKSS